MVNTNLLKLRGIRKIDSTGMAVVKITVVRRLKPTQSRDKTDQ